MKVPTVTWLVRAKYKLRAKQDIMYYIPPSTLGHHHHRPFQLFGEVESAGGGKDLLKVWSRLESRVEARRVGTELKDRFLDQRVCNIKV